MAALCPVCARPVAVARPRCVYCGAPLSAEAVGAAEKISREAHAEPGASREKVERVLLILDLIGVSPGTLARALGLSSFEAAQRAARGGYELLKTVARSEEGEAVAALRAAGLAVFSVPDAEARARPLFVRGGDFAEGRLRLRTQEADVDLGGDDLLLVVRGPIVREYQPTNEVKRFRTASLAGGFLVHLHRMLAEQPLELDPFNFEFGFTPAQGSLLELNLWLESLGAPIDEAFKKLTPALAPAAKGAAGVTAPARALVRTSGEGPPVLDNVEQFRFYSGWRGAVERRRW